MTRSRPECSKSISYVSSVPGSDMGAWLYSRANPTPRAQLDIGRMFGSPDTMRRDVRVLHTRCLVCYGHGSRPEGGLRNQGWGCIGMRITALRGLASGSRRPVFPRAHGIFVASLLAAVTGALLAAPAAFAGIQQEYAEFSDCPVTAPTVSICVISRTTSGEFHIGAKTVPIDQTITLQGATQHGLRSAASGGRRQHALAHALVLPGGLIGLEVLPPLTEVTATAELAGGASLNVDNALGAKTPAVTLPIKVKLSNPLLGAACYIGSDSSPLTLHLTTGTTSPPAPTKPISRQNRHAGACAGNGDPRAERRLARRQRVPGVGRERLRRPAAAAGGSRRRPDRRRTRRSGRTTRRSSTRTSSSPRRAW